METKDKQFFLTIFLGTIVGAIICRSLKKSKMNGFDGDEVNSYANGIGGTSDTTQSLDHNMPIHNEKDLRMAGGKRGHRIKGGESGTKVKKFWDAYNAPGTQAYTQAARDWFEYKHPGADEFTTADAVNFFKANGSPKVRLVQLGWAKRHGINDPKVAESFWSKSLTNGDPDQMRALYKAFYPEHGHKGHKHQSMPTGQVKGDMALGASNNDVV